jgi:hypothetical protein
LAAETHRLSAKKAQLSTPLLILRRGAQSETKNGQLDTPLLILRRGARSEAEGGVVKCI